MSPTELADLIDKSDHMILMNPHPKTEEEWVKTYVDGEDHNLVVEALRAYARSRPL